MHRIFISDVHLASVESPQFAALGALLEREGPRVDEIYLLGDLCEAWVGDDDDGPLATQLARLLLSTSKHCLVAMLHGNRDFLLGQDFASRCQLKLLDDLQPLDTNTAVAHGDQFCVDDAQYQQLRRTLRSPQWQQEVLAKPLAERRQLAQALRAQSMHSNANKPQNIMDVNVAEIHRQIAGLNVQWLIHGHTHRPGVHRHDWGLRYVLGDWAHCGWLVRQQGVTTPQLECFPLADRYET